MSARFLFLLPVIARAEEHGHGHDWEWAGVFSLNANEGYTWSAARDEGTGMYADPHMKMVVCPTATADMAGLEAVEEKAHTRWHGSFKEISPGSTFSVGSACDAFELDFDSSTWLSLFNVKATVAGSYAFFCEHFPTEFETDFHYFKDEHGHDIEPAFVEGQDTLKEPITGGFGGWALAIGGAFLSTLPALLLIACVGPGMGSFGMAVMSRLFPFTSGAVAGVAVFLVLPEGLLLVGEAGVWKWGTAVLLGWLIGVVVHHMVGIISPDDGHGHGKPESVRSSHIWQGREAGLELVSQASQKADGDGSQALNVQGDSRGVDWAVASPLLFGDFVHGIIDGLLIGFSARACSPALTWGIILGTIAHEAPQEIGDFVLLIVKARMSWKQATFWNFASAQGAVLGAIVGYSVNVSGEIQGLALALCGGTFLFIALSELGPYMVHPPSNKVMDSLLIVFSFVVGATAIGLILLDHGHCEAEGGGHGGHGGDGGGHGGHGGH